MKTIKCLHCGKNMYVHFTGDGGHIIKCTCGNWDFIAIKGKEKRKRLKFFAREERKLKNLVCPLCGEKLKAGELRNYETLCEHCFDPNDETERLRRTFVCVNKTCRAHGNGFWGYDGGNYFRGVPRTPDLAIYPVNKGAA